MPIENNFPTYELTINPENNSFVSAIGIVDSPAIQSDFFAFSENKKYQFLNEERKETIGAVMIPNQKIYRRDSDGKEYYVFFSVDTIRQIAQYFFEKGFTNCFNINHNENENAGAYVFQSFIVDSNLGVSAPEKLGSFPDGTWIIGTKITDSNTWDLIKKGELNGFSVEGIFQTMQTMKKAEIENKKVNYIDKEVELYNSLIALNKQLASLQNKN